MARLTRGRPPARSAGVAPPDAAAKERAASLNTPKARLAPKLRAPAPKRFTLYGTHLSGPTYKVALMLHMAGEPYSYVHVDLRGGEQNTPAFRAKNRYGQVPCLVDGKLNLCQSAAILLHLAEVLQRFMPRGAEARARVREWMFWEFDRLAAPVYRSRAFRLGIRRGPPEVVEHFRGAAEEALRQLEAAMPEDGFLVGARPSIADIDLYGVVRYAAEAGLALDAFPRLAAWARRIETLPRFAAPDDLLPRESRV